MRVKLMNLNEMTDSRMMMEHKLLPLAVWFVYGLLAFLVALGIWAYFGEVDVVVKARGSVRPTETVATITSKTSGKIKGLYVSRNQTVEQGTLLMSLDDSELQIQKKAIALERQQLLTELDMTKRFIEGLEKGSNPFSKVDEEAYFFQFEKFQMDNRYSVETNALTQDKLTRVKKELSEMQTLLGWVQGNAAQKKVTLTALESKYKQFILDQKGLISKKDSALKQYATLKELYLAGSTSKSDLDSAERLVESTTLALEQFLVQYKNALAEKIENLQATEYELSNTLTKNEPSTGLGSQINWQTAKNQLEKNIDLLNKKLESVDLSIEQCHVKATMAGTFNQVTELAVGDYIGSGIVLCTLIPEEDNSAHFLAEMALSNHDVGRVKTGDEVKFKLDALSYKEYGFLKGKIVSISPDAIVDEKTGMSYYKALATVDNKPLTSYKGVEKRLKVGMSYEAHVVSERKKILWVLLEKLQLSL